MSERTCCICDRSVDIWRSAGARAYICEDDALRVKDVLVAYLGIGPAASDDYGVSIEWGAAMDIIRRFRDSPQRLTRILPFDDRDRAKASYDLDVEHRIRSDGEVKEESGG